MSNFDICPVINTSTYSTSFTEEGNQNVYFSKTILGVIGFSNSINTILKTNKKSWEDFSFSKMTLQVQSRDTSLTSGFSIGLFSSEKPIGTISNTDDSILNKIVTYTNCDSTNFTISKPTNFSKNVYSFSFLSLFQGLTKDDEQKFSPDSEYWYLVLWHSTLSSSETFYSRNYSDYKLFKNTDINGSIVNQTMQFQIQGDFVTSPFRYYENDTWKILTPYIYDGKWIKLGAQMF